MSPDIAGTLLLIGTLGAIVATIIAIVRGKKQTATILLLIVLFFIILSLIL